MAHTGLGIAPTTRPPRRGWRPRMSDVRPVAGRLIDQTTHTRMGAVARRAARAIGHRTKSGASGSKRSTDRQSFSSASVDLAGKIQMKCRSFRPPLSRRSIYRPQGRRRVSAASAALQLDNVGLVQPFDNFVIGKSEPAMGVFIAQGLHLMRQKSAINSGPMAPAHAPLSPTARAGSSRKCKT
ncbi:MAG: hypothetical protein CM15mP21_1930 [Hyphomicrobiales bacterium]|nr:MAG: hypothetical protein CM15mP21_1930 [Hyphomicrobiales bacterium]